MTDPRAQLPERGAGDPFVGSVTMPPRDGFTGIPASAPELQAQQRVSDPDDIWAETDEADHLHLGVPIADVPRTAQPERTRPPAVTDERSERPERPERPAQPTPNTVGVSRPAGGIASGTLRADAPHPATGVRRSRIIAAAAAAAVAAVTSAAAAAYHQPATNTTVAPAALPTHAAAPADTDCPTTTSGQVTTGRDAGGPLGGPQVIKAFDYAYYVDRDGAKARSNVPANAPMGSAEQLQASIDQLDPDTVHCLKITDRGAGLWGVQLTELPPRGMKPRSIYQQIQTYDAQGRTWIQSIVPDPQRPTQ